MLNAIPVVLPSWDEVLKASTKEEVETSKAVESVYSFTESELNPTTNIFVPSLLNANPVGVPS